MFPDQTIKASLATHNPRAYPVISPEIRTSTTVVKSLGCSLLKASPGQRSFAMYMKEGFNTGKRPGVAESHWINLRRVASHMCTIEAHAIKESKALRPKDRELAARKSINFLDKLMLTIDVEEKAHPAFRKELIEHLENIVKWYPRSISSWNTAYKHLLSDEFLTIKGRQCDTRTCLLVMSRLAGKKTE